MSGRCLNGPVSTVSAMLGAIALTPTPERADFGSKTLRQQTDHGLGRAIDRKPRLDRHRSHDEHARLPPFCSTRMRPKAWKDHTVPLMLRLMTRSRSLLAIVQDKSCGC